MFEHGRRAGLLRLNEDEFSPSLATPASLEFVGNPDEFPVIYQDAAIR